jgi:hypothetical protein
MLSAATTTKIVTCYQYFSEYFGLLRTKSVFGLFSLSNLQSLKTFCPKPFLSILFRNLAGIIWSVSIFSVGKGMAVEVICKLLHFLNF